MTIKQVKKIFFENIDSFNKAYGFVSKKTAFELIKKEENRTIVISFTHNSFYDEIELIPCLEIHMHDVEEIVEKCLGRKVATLAMDLLSIKVFYQKGEKHIEKQIIERENRFHLFEDSDILSTPKQLANLYEEYGLRYIEEYGTKEAIHNLFNKNPKAISYHHTAWGYQAMSGIIVAKLLDSRDYNKILKAYQKEHTKKDPWGIDEFECVVKNLS